MTPEQASEMQASLLREHFANMARINERGAAQTQQWAAVHTAVVDQIRTGQQTVHGIVERQRREIAERTEMSTWELVAPVDAAPVALSEASCDTEADRKP